METVKTYGYIFKESGSYTITSNDVLTVLKVEDVENSDIVITLLKDKNVNKKNKVEIMNESDYPITINGEKDDSYLIESGESAIYFYQGENLEIIAEGGGWNGKDPLGDIVVDNITIENNVDVKGNIKGNVIGNLSGDVTGGVTCSSGKDIYLNNSAIVSHYTEGDDIRNANNVDHIWHEDGQNTWHLCSDTTYKAQGNSKLQIGSLSATDVSYTKLLRPLRIVSESMNYELYHGGLRTLDLSSISEEGQILTVTPGTGIDVRDQLVIVNGSDFDVMVNDFTVKSKTSDIFHFVNNIFKQVLAICSSVTLCDPDIVIDDNYQYEISGSTKGNVIIISEDVTEQLKITLSKGISANYGNVCKVINKSKYEGYQIVTNEANDIIYWVNRAGDIGSEISLNYQGSNLKAKGNILILSRGDKHNPILKVPPGHYLIMVQYMPNGQIFTCDIIIGKEEENPNGSMAPWSVGNNYMTYFHTGEWNTNDPEHFIREIWKIEE